MASPSYPAALDSLANPGATTETDDAGFELDLVVSRLQNICMAIEQKIGIGGGGPGGASVLRRTATGASGWGQLQNGDIADNVIMGGLGGPGTSKISPGSIITTDLQANTVGKRQLDYVAATDLQNGVTPFTGNTWTDFHTGQSFTVDVASSVVQIAIYGNIYAYSPGGATQCVVRVVVDISGSPQAAQYRSFSSGYSNLYGNALNGGGPITLNNLVAGTHTVRLQIYPSVYNQNIYCRASTQPTTEFFAITVTEWKR